MPKVDYVLISQYSLTKKCPSGKTFRMAVLVVVVMVVVLKLGGTVEAGVRYKVVDCVADTHRHSGSHEVSCREDVPPICGGSGGGGDSCAAWRHCRGRGEA